MECGSASDATSDAASSPFMTGIVGCSDCLGGDVTLT